jgi:hypothetical protein
VPQSIFENIEKEQRQTKAAKGASVVRENIKFKQLSKYGNRLFTFPYKP